MKLKIALGLLMVLLGSMPFAHAQTRATAITVPVDVVFCVDYSDSMRPYLEQTKGLIRSISRGLAAQHGVFQTDLRIGLVQYGYQENYRVLPLSGDLNALLEAVEGAENVADCDEWVGRVVEVAQQKMEWRRGDVFRAIYVLGNQSANFGPVSPRQSVPRALANGIAVNAVQCEAIDLDLDAAADSRQNPATDRITDSQAWMELARLGKGDYFHFGFKQNAPFDAVRQAAFSRQSEEQQRRELKSARVDQLINPRLGVGLRLLEQTSLPNGAQDSLASRGYKIMLKVDESLGGTTPFAATSASLERALGEALSGRHARDLVDYSRAAGFDISAVSNDALPLEMRAMSLAERQFYLNGLATRRQQIRAQLASLQTQRLYLKSQ